MYLSPQIHPVHWTTILINFAPCLPVFDLASAFVAPRQCIFNPVCMFLVPPARF
ncbi:hypothetical protein BU15DRAFT_83937 [Melanogaster broomeanus]|nr:hypothetical protein BU15DRAFT_83937 [Melanogaster broomeanus]